MTETLRPLAFSIAYRMLGSVAEAEDVVQEALLRVHDAQRSGEPLRSPEAYLSTVVTRLSIDQLRSARVRRETYVGAWLPEPLLTHEDDPARHAETADTLSTAFLVLLERLSPVERAVFLLRQVFGYGYEEIAEIVDRTPENCRQLATRARRHVDAGRPRFDVSAERKDALADSFFAAVEEGDMDALVELLASDVALYGDGGGKAPALARPLSGPQRVARTLLAWALHGRRAGFRLERVEVNGQPGAIGRGPDGALVNVTALDIVDGRVQAVRSVVNPDKLRHLGRVASWP